MEEVSISQVDIQANTLEENDLLLISQYKQDGTFDSAKIEGRNLKQKMPGLMVRLWNCHDAQLELPFDNRDVINNLTYQDDSFVWYNSRSGTKEEVICEAANEPLATDGCSILYKRLDSNNRYFHDQYNNTDFWYYAGSYDSKAKYKWTFTKYRTVDDETHLHTYEIYANELKDATIYDLVVYVDEDKVTQVTDFQKLSDPDRFSFTLTIETHEDDTLTSKTVTTYDDVYFTDFVKSSEPVTPATTIDKGDMPDEKVMLFQGRIKLNKGQTVYFKGNVDDYASIFVNNICLCDFVNYKQEEIDVSFTAPDDRKYYDFKLIIVNRGGSGPGFENDYPKYSDLMMMVSDVHDDYVKMTNQIFDANNQFFFLPANCDEYYRKSQNLRDHGAVHKAGVLIKMWHTGYEVGRLSASCIFDHNVINECSSDDYLIKDAVSMNGKKYDLYTYENLNVSDGCEMLYSTVKNKYDPYFFDWFNGKCWNYYSGSSDSMSKTYQYDNNPLDKKVLVYFGDIYLPKGQTIYFCGRIDDCVSVLIDSNYPLTQDSEKIPLIGVHSTDWTKNWKTYAYTSEYTGYHSLKIVACNCYEDGGPADTNIVNGRITFVLQMSFNNKDWYHISNEGLGRNALFIPEGDKYDEIYKVAELTRDNIKRTRLPGMLVRMWEATVPADNEGKNHCNINRINYVQPEADKIDYGLTVNGTNYDLWSCYDLNVTQGCGILYKVEKDTDKNYYDPYNAIKWDFSSISDYSKEKHKEKVLAYYTELFLHAGQTVCFKGIPDDTLSIIFDDNDFPVDSEGNKLCYICCIEPVENANKADSNVTFRYTAKETKYYKMRIIVSSKGGPGGFDDVNQATNSGLMISFDGGVIWKLITNEDFTSPVFFIPEAERYTKIWYDAERARNTNNHYIDFEDPSPVTKKYDTVTSNSQIWTANDNGTLFVCVGCHTPAESTYPTLWAAMPQSDTWVEIAQFGPHHGGGMTGDYRNVNVEIPMRVARGTRVKLTNIDSIQYDNVKLFRDLNFNYFSTYNVPNGYLVTFLNGYNGGTIATRNNVPEGTTLSTIKPSNPTRDSDAQYSYAFNGWDKADTYTIIENTDVTAKWTSTIRTYNVQFVNNAGTVLKSYSSVKYGTDISSTMPTTATAEEQETGYTYLFAKWDKNVNTTVSSDATYNAIYNKVQNKDTYTVIFKNCYDGSVVGEAENVVSGTTIGSIKPKINPDRPGEGSTWYIFDGWDKDDDYKVESNLVVIPKWRTKKWGLVVSFENNGGTVIKEQHGYYGDEIIVPADPTYENPETGKTYVFTGWTPTPPKTITNSGIYTATYNDDTNYTVNFYDSLSPDTLIATANVKSGTVLARARSLLDNYATADQKDAQYTYTFKNYMDKTLTTEYTKDYVVTGDLDVYLNWTKTVNQYTIRFLNSDGSVLQSSTLDYGAYPSYTGETPTSGDKVFTGWEPAMTKVFGNADYIAKYKDEDNKYIVSFVDGLGNTVASVTDVPYGTRVSSIKPAIDPTRASDTQYDYIFRGWDKTDGKVIYENCIITATWCTKVRSYTINFLNNDGSYLQQQTLEYGSTPKYSGSTPVYVNPETGKTYTFTGWTPTITTVTGNASYAAVYNSEYIDCTVTFKHSDDSSVLATTTVKYGTTIGTAKSCVTTTPTKSGYTFNGWDKADSYIVVGDTEVITTWRVAVTYVKAKFYQNSCSASPFKTVSVVKGSKLTSSQIPSSTESNYTGWTRTWDKDTSVALNSDTDFYGTYDATITFNSTSSLSTSAWTQLIKNTSLQLPAGLSITASVSGTAYHKASPTSHAVALRLRSNIDTDIGDWEADEISGSSSSWVTFNIGACKIYEITSDTYLALEAKKVNSCTVSWVLRGTVSLSMS